MSQEEKVRIMLQSNFKVLIDNFQSKRQLQVEYGYVNHVCLSKYVRAYTRFAEFLGEKQWGSYTQAITAFYRDRFRTGHALVDTAEIFSNLATFFRDVGLQDAGDVCGVYQDLLWELWYVASGKPNRCIGYLDKSLGRAKHAPFQAATAEDVGLNDNIDRANSLVLQFKELLQTALGSSNSLTEKNRRHAAHRPAAPSRLRDTPKSPGRKRLAKKEQA